jgi:hypothetical protein
MAKGCSASFVVGAVRVVKDLLGKDVANDINIPSGLDILG